jgi:CRISPR/Cas system Type II protein with McrA/HNH and RuvC-like nuclease domain
MILGPPLLANIRRVRNHHDIGESHDDRRRIKRILRRRIWEKNHRINVTYVSVRLLCLIFLLMVIMGASMECHMLGDHSRLPHTCGKPNCDKHHGSTEQSQRCN